MTSPFFSIIIPALNEEVYLPKLLNCLLKQTFPNFEVIIADGGSKDKTIPFVKEFQKKFEKQGQSLTFHVSPNKNVPSQRNLGAKDAKGSYLIFFDADVAPITNFLQDMYDHIQQTHDLLLTTWCIPDDSDRINTILSYIMNWSIMVTRKSSKPLLPGFNITIEKDLFNKIKGFDETLVLAEDHALAEAVRKQGVVVSFLKKPILIYSLRRFRSESRLLVLLKYIWSTLYIWFKGPIKHQIYEYKMGGESRK
jgi:glycosyltransferase involved in cell wall biosynthesis